MNIPKTIFVCLLVLGVGSLGVWFLYFNRAIVEKREIVVKPPTVASAILRGIDRRIDVETQGTVRPRTEIDLVAQVAGEVIEISSSLANGGFFAKGEVMVRLDDRDYQLEVVRAKAAVAQSKLSVSLQEAEAEIARQEWQALGKGEATKLTLHEPQVLEAKAMLAAAEAVLGKAQLALTRTQIRAPFAGRVRRKSVDTGQFVSMGTRLAQVYSVDFVEVRLPLHDSKLKYVDLPLAYRDASHVDVAGAATTEGDGVTLRARFAQAEHEWSGTIVRTEGEIDAKSRMVHAIVRVDDPYGRQMASQRPPLSVGMFVSATIRGRTFPGVYEVPRRALREGQYILIINTEMRLEQRSVSVLLRGDDVVVIDGGVSEGERVCLSPVAVFFEGMQVKLDESKEVEATKAQTEKLEASGR